MKRSVAAELRVLGRESRVAEMRGFIPPTLLRNAHAMTIAAAFWPRRFPKLPPAEAREFETEPATWVLAKCHWQPNWSEMPALLMVHGLEGSSESGYMLGLAEKAWAMGWSAIRLNQRNCGGTDRLTPTLYHSGLSIDVRKVTLELLGTDGVPELFVVGFSMGGNLVLKMAGEFGEDAPAGLAAVAGVCPAIDLAQCARALERGENFLYERHFVDGLKKRFRLKAKLFPGRYDAGRLAGVRTVWEFDEKVTAPYSGFAGADDYYARSNARKLLGNIRVPALLLAAEDDPFVPVEAFKDPAIAGNENITTEVTQYGGHCAFVASAAGEGGRFWGELRVIEFFMEHSRMIPPSSAAAAAERVQG
jgi:predicted alpha/beta-fold hydrolase